MIINDNCLVQLTVVTPLLYMNVLARLSSLLKLYTYICYHLYCGTSKQTLLLFANRTHAFVNCLFLPELDCSCLSPHENYYYVFQKKPIRSLHHVILIKPLLIPSYTLLHLTS